jgi:mono/diheme cytochrome c family protein/cytochrome c2
MSEQTKARSATPRRVPRPVLRIFTTGFLLLVMMALGAVVFVLWGVYNVSALQQHTRPVYIALDAALKRSISQRAGEIETPPLSDPALIEQGLQHYRRTCVQCHGAPGVARDDVGKGLTPIPANLVQTARHWTPAEIFWTVKHGIKMTGMPAWRFEFTDEEIWSIVAFVMQLPRLTPAEYKAMDARVAAVAGGDGEAGAGQAQAPAAPDPQRGRLALQGYACTACHRIPGVVGPDVDVGPPLRGVAERSYIAGVLPNTFDNMVRWIRDPTAVDPRTAMPDLNVGERDAIDMAAYLYTPR